MMKDVAGCQAIILLKVALACIVQTYATGVVQTWTHVCLQIRASEQKDKEFEICSLSVRRGSGGPRTFPHASTVVCVA